MEREQKKLLLVAVSVGVFLLVTITAAIVVLTPRANIEEAAFIPSQPFPAGRIQETIAIPPVPPVTEAPSIVGIQDPLVTAPVVDTDDGDILRISVPRPTTAAVPDTPPAVAERPVATVTPRPAPVARPAPAPAPAARPAPAPAARPAPAAPARPAAPPARTVNDFWIQAGAFSAKVRADDARELLASMGITSIIENRTIDGRTWYRVRLGPYASKNEASHWLSLVQTIEGFENSQIRQSVRRL